MKQNFSKILNVVCCIALVYCAVQISGLKNDIDILKNNVNANNRNIENSISNIYYNVNNMLEEQVNILSVNQGEIVSADVENMTADIIYSVTPKEYNPLTTKALLTVDGKQHEMEYKEGKYTLQITAPLAKTTTVESVDLIDNNTIRNQIINNSFSPRYDYLTIVYSDLNWSGSGKPDGDEYVWSIDGTIHIDADCKGREPKIVKAELVQLVNGKEISRQPLTPVQYPDNHEYQAAGTTAGHEEIWPSRNFRYELKQDIRIPRNSTLYLCTDVTDGDGLVHRSYIEGWVVDSNLKSVNGGDIYHGMEAVEIYSRDGELIYSIEEELYK